MVLEANISKSFLSYRYWRAFLIPCSKSPTVGVLSEDGINRAACRDRLCCIQSTESNTCAKKSSEVSRPKALTF